MDKREHARIAREIIDSNVYMTLGTAGPDGRPWVSPVYFASNDYKQFLWVSRPEAQHSQNIRGRPEISIVIFDSRIPVGHGQAVYMAGRAEEVSNPEHEEALNIYPGPPERGARPFAIEDVRDPAPFRLYRASIENHWILNPGGHPLHPEPSDHRVSVQL